jgi:hypothetical protein
MEASVKEKGSAVEIGVPHPLFEMPLYFGHRFGGEYTVAPNGQRFVFNALPQGSAPAPLTLVTNWTAGLKWSRPSGRHQRRLHYYFPQIFPCHRACNVGHLRAPKGAFVPNLLKTSVLGPRFLVRLALGRHLSRAPCQAHRV